jgi:hypothetical protein
MNGALILLAIALLLIGLLCLLLRRSDFASSPDASTLVSDAATPSAYREFEERRGELLDRIFGPDDWEFVSSHAPKRAQRLFLQERKEIAFYWLSQIRSLAKTAMRIHIACARKSAELRPVLELRLAIDYFIIRVKCAFVAAILWLGGPLALRRMIKQVGGLSDELRGMLELASKGDVLPGEARVPR